LGNYNNVAYNQSSYAPAHAVLQVDGVDVSKNFLIITIGMLMEPSHRMAGRFIRLLNGRQKAQTCIAFQNCRKQQRSRLARLLRLALH